ncbi:hypothetical protein MY04_0814 [Flammeovirga sp. MY04]|uniref:hypothetical protein n=1 Tax=Flammeovirga sp. MY04 TaxID=1191459 RepID=UPI0008060A29|nr:hypothetical protein [Flammeovirga sp. MY04]ANQ48196.1 hypothetical protein MY04_0814 [Flammeovirga sp. MY04]
MTSNFDPKPLLKKDIFSKLNENLKSDFGKLVFAEPYTEEKFNIIKGYELNQNQIDLVVKKNGISPKIFGFIILNENTYRHRILDLKNALKSCDALYIVIDLKKRNHLYDLLNDEILNEIGIVGTLSNQQFELCKKAENRGGITPNFQII